MNFSDSILKFSEIAIFNLRELFTKHGYTRFDMNKFEEYELYAANKAFLGTDDIITFTDVGGRLLALRPDVTLSVIKNAETTATRGVSRLYYDENVYRRAGLGHEFRERMQSGVECIGDIGVEEMSEVLSLAAASLGVLTERGCIAVSHMGFLAAFLSELKLSDDDKKRLLHYISDKNTPETRKLTDELAVPDELADKLLRLTALDGAFETALDELAALSVNDGTAAAVAELREVLTNAKMRCPSADFRLDFSVAGDMRYYDGIIFSGYSEGIPTAILSGGRYDGLMHRLRRDNGAIGFAVYIDLLERANEDTDFAAERGFINVALPKGRLGEQVYAIFEKRGYGCDDILSDTRKLVFENAVAGVRYFWVKPSDVAIYVERGAADIGVCGSDIIAEHSPDVYELHDLGIGVCRLAVAAPKDFADTHSGVLRVATKFTETAKRHYASHNREIDIITLNGSIELAPLLGLSDVIVDIVETGNTLRANGLEVKDDICGISARVIANKSGFKFKRDAIARLMEAIADS